MINIRSKTDNTITRAPMPEMPDKMDQLLQMASTLYGFYDKMNSSPVQIQGGGVPTGYNMELDRMSNTRSVVDRRLDALRGIPRSNA